MIFISSSGRPKNRNRQTPKKDDWKEWEKQLYTQDMHFCIWFSLLTAAIIFALVYFSGG